MLKLTAIKKDYEAGDSVVHALKGVDLEFRKSEFVAILGHSGCGKTTLLNIIGGLDQYTSGDLCINGKSTKNFSDSDWDSYRNHSVGFVFQSYNLIPHQTVLSNVELALTLSGVGPAERKEKAKAALERVGLGDQLYKKPNQMSGGQMQRVAIARALVNDPEILMADEPTGALDSETSVQIMDLLKEISKDKLIIMVTHNPELALSYASRVIRLKDGRIVDDSDPYSSGDGGAAEPHKVEKTSMSFLTALSLSTNNLMTKKARTLLTAFAGSIGIIGIALIMSISNGIQNYIDKVQEDTLSSYPITIQAESMDMAGMMTDLMGVHAQAMENQHEKDAVYSSTVMYDMMNAMVSAETKTNDLESFKSYLEDSNGALKEHMSSVQYSYDLDMNMYSEDEDGNIVKADVLELMEQAMTDMYGGDYSNYFATYGQMYAGMNVWQELLPGVNGELVDPLLEQQYDVLYGHWPENYDELVLVVDQNNEISDLAMYTMGLKSNSSMSQDLQDFMDQKNVAAKAESWSYEDICNRSFRYIYPSDQYKWDEEKEEYTDMAKDELGLKTLFGNGMEVKIVGVVRQNEDALTGMLSPGSLAYTHELVEHIVTQAEDKELVAKQLSQPKTDVFNGLPFLELDDESLNREKKIQAAKDYIASADDSQLAELYVDFMSIPEDSYIQDMIDEEMEGTTRKDIEDMVLEYSPSYASMLEDMDDETLFDFVKDMIASQAKEQYAIEMEKVYRYLPDSKLARDFGLLSLEEDDYLWLYEHSMPPVYSDSTLEKRLMQLGYVNLDSPSVINIYASTFEDKDAIADAIAAYNDKVPEEQKIEYTDMVALLMSSITSVINVISYVLIAFVGISLVVSSIMIGIITYISVLERTKEIGILRAIGASKKDVSRVFNAETFIVGLIAGLIGIGVTIILNFPVNAMIHDITGIYNIHCSLPLVGAIGLVAISVLLTFVAGLIPSGLAAKKDPVEALRTE